MAQQGSGVSPAYGVEVGLGETGGAQGGDRIVGAHVEGEVRAEQHPVGAG